MSYNKAFRELLANMGLDADKRLPDTKTEPVIVWWKGYKVNVWVAPKLGRMSLRIHAYCPVCGRELAAARLPQHVNTVRCLTNAGAKVVVRMAHGTVIPIAQPVTT